MSYKPITVTQLNTYIKQVFDAEELLHGICVVGEISGWSNVRGTAYFTLKDESSALSCVCFSADDFADFKNGDSVMVIGSVKYYNKAGKINFTVVKIEQYGQSLIYKKFLELKEKLSTLGYFDEENKKQLPKDIKRIGVVSSEGGAVIRDIINVRTRRNPSIDIVLYPVKVQGDGAENEIAHGIEVLDGYNVDVIVVARGGGSFEDLQPFNTEIVANATHNCNKFIMSAVGHETDYTIIDFCSDMRAPTPSVAAELICADVNDRKNILDGFKKRLFIQMDNYLKGVKQRIVDYSSNIVYKYNEYIEDCYNVYNYDIVALKKNIDLYIDKREYMLGSMLKVFEKLNPNEILKLGYACVKYGGEYITTCKNLNKNDTIDIVFKDGVVNAEIKDIDKRWKMSFEDGVKELEAIIQKLESGDLKFDEAATMFERGAQLCKELNEKFENVKGKVTVIRESLGSLIEENME